jgi:hypothetical protein
MEVHKELFQLLQCIHHLERTNTKQLPKAFHKKQQELFRFIRPAQRTDSFNKDYQSLVTKFLGDSLDRPYSLAALSGQALRNSRVSAEPEDSQRARTRGFQDGLALGEKELWEETNSGDHTGVP